MHMPSKIASADIAFIQPLWHANCWSRSDEIFFGANKRLMLNCKHCHNIYIYAVSLFLLDSHELFCDAARALSCSGTELHNPNTLEPEHLYEWSYDPEIAHKCYINYTSVYKMCYHVFTLIMLLSVNVFPQSGQTLCVGAVCFFLWRPKLDSLMVLWHMSHSTFTCPFRWNLYICWRILVLWWKLKKSRQKYNSQHVNCSVHTQTYLSSHRSHSKRPLVCLTLWCVCCCACEREVWPQISQIYFSLTLCMSLMCFS